MNNGNGKGLTRLRLAFAFAVVLVWVAAVVISLSVPNHPVDPWVHMMTAAVATFLLGPTIWKR